MTARISATLLLALLAGGCTPKEKAGKTGKSPSSEAQNQGGGQSGAPSGDEAAGASVNSGAGGAATIYVVNVADETICFVYLGDGSDNWTGDLLGSNVLEPGTYLTVAEVTPGFVEIYAEGCTSSDWYGSADVSGEYTFILTGGGGGDDTGYTYDTGY